MEVKACGLSEVGLSRGHNEDSFEIHPGQRLYLVADGMGGHSHGEVASRTAVRAIRDYLAAGAGSEDGSSGTSGDTSAAAHPFQRLEAAIRSAHERVLEAIRRDDSLYGMGTTVVGLLLEAGTASIAHVGDSRVYRLRDGRLHLLTQDHTWVHEQVLAGFLSEDQARVHPLRNVVTRALGGEGDLLVDLREEEVRPGDRYLLCSDGLTTMLRDEEITERLASDASLQQICRRLVSDAKSRGGFDDVTVVIVETGEAE
jgi:protein phosphatase